MPENILITASTSELAGSFVQETLVKNPSLNLMLVSRKKQQEISHPSANILQLDSVDLTDFKSQHILKEASSNFFDGPIQTIHFAGAFWIHKPLVRTEFSEIKEMMDSHYLTLCNVAQCITPLMIRLGGGKLVAFSCNSVGYNYPDMIAFTCAKAAVETFIKCYSNEYSPYNISAAAIALPTIRTNRVIEEKPNGDHDNYVTPEEVGKILAHQIAEMNQYVSGNVIKLFKHSASFYHEGYFTRNPRTLEI
ncbi:MAG: SDR family oxidoreductase [Cyclobacteriaceae bacterium]